MADDLLKRLREYQKFLEERIEKTEEEGSTAKPIQDQPPKTIQEQVHYDLMRLKKSQTYTGCLLKLYGLFPELKD